MKAFGRFIRFIPGFRQMSSGSMIIAVTYYGAAAVISFQYWHWGLALLALPFLVFYLLDLNAAKGGRLPLAVSVAAGLCVLLGTALALSTGGLPAGGNGAAGSYATLPASASREARQSAPAALTGAPGTAPASPERRAETTPPASASPTVARPASTPGPDEAQYAYVASKNSKTFHLPGCPSAKRIKPENLIGFRTRDEALAAGLQPCKRCNP